MVGMSSKIPGGDQLFTLTDCCWMSRSSRRALCLKRHSMLKQRRVLQPTELPLTKKEQSCLGHHIILPEAPQSPLCAAQSCYLLASKLDSTLVQF